MGKKTRYKIKKPRYISRRSGATYLLILYEKPFLN
jgi:hypothetical protein